MQKRNCKKSAKLICVKNQRKTPVLVVLNKLVKTFGKKSISKCGLIRTRQLH
jgi:hypothetical protein